MKDEEACGREWTIPQPKAAFLFILLPSSFILSPMPLPRGLCLLLLFSLAIPMARSAPPPPVAEAIRAEAVRKNHDPEGRPLPLVAHWHRMSCPLSFQIELIEQGHHLLPWISTPMPTPGRKMGKGLGAGDEEGLKQLAEWKLPFAVVTGGQWEASLYDSNERWRSLPPEQSPLVWLRQPVGEKLTGKLLSPFGAVEPWREVGRYWMESPGMKQIQELYPDPPLALIISNNESGRERWHQVQDLDQRYVAAYGLERDDNFKRKVTGDGWMERYGAMIAAMRVSLTTDAWKKNSRFIAYNAMGPNHFGREVGWMKYALTTEDRVDPSPLTWEGAVPEYYDNGWQQAKSVFNVFSSQVETMNYIFQKAEVDKQNPDFWFELIFWDGNLAGGKGAEKDRYKSYAEIGFPSTPARYQGWVQYGMWLTVPRVAREWRSSADSRERWWDYFSRIIDAVDRVHTVPVLTRFWRKGELVPNRAHPHPFDKEVPEKWKNADRWFSLDTNLDPPRPWELTTRLPIFSLARVIGEAPKREWLLYAHAPMGDKAGVEITIPEYRKVTVDVSLGGSFYRIKEVDGSVASVGK